MFVFPQQCKNFQEWLDREIAATEQWSKNARGAVWEDAGEHEDTLLERTLTVYRAETILSSMNDVREALASFSAE